MARRVQTDRHNLTTPSLYLAVASLAQLAYMQIFAGVAERPVLLFASLLVLNILLLCAAALNPQLRSAGEYGSAAGFLIVTAWSMQHLNTGSHANRLWHSASETVWD
jgi:hypothetical protein